MTVIVSWRRKPIGERFWRRFLCSGLKRSKQILRRRDYLFDLNNGTVGDCADILALSCPKNGAYCRAVFKLDFTGTHFCEEIFIFNGSKKFDSVVAFTEFPSLREAVGHGADNFQNNFGFVVRQYNPFLPAEVLAVTFRDDFAFRIAGISKNGDGFDAFLIQCLFDFLLALKDEDSLLSHGASPVISSMGSCC